MRHANIEPRFCIVPPEAGEEMIAARVILAEIKILVTFVHIFTRVMTEKSRGCLGFFCNNVA